MQNFIDIYTGSGKESIYNITPASVKRDWMDNNRGYAYKCLPLNIANQHGWVAYFPLTFSATWGGEDRADSISIKIHDEDSTLRPVSHFGNGILTMPTDFVIRTNENVSLYVRGATNSIYDNIYPLDGIIETDWLPFTFTMNYKFSKPGTATFKKGDMAFMFFPIQRDFVESFDINYKSFNSNPKLQEEYSKYGELRTRHIDQKETSFQRFYLKGEFGDVKKDLVNHRIKLNLNFPKPSV